MGKNKNKKQLQGLPEKFLKRLTNMFGVSLFNQIKITFIKRPTTFRINTIKANQTEVIEILKQNGFKFERISWYKEAFILKNKSKRDLTNLDIYKEGKIYIQSLASMVPPLVLDLKSGEKVLDLTAAPGSKTSQIAALMNKQGELVANDNNKIRFFKLKHNMEVLGVLCYPEKNFGKIETEDLLKNKKDSLTVSTKNEFVQNNDWKFILRMEHGAVLTREYPEYFDKILLDAPCSAEARFIEGEPKTYGYWKEQKIKEMAYKQRQLLLSAWKALKPGGILVYSTCTFSPEENELQITRFMDRIEDCEIMDIDLLDFKCLPILKNWNEKEINKEVIKKSLRIMPTKEIEGFFVVKMRKKFLE